MNASPLRTSRAATWAAAFVAIACLTACNADDPVTPQEDPGDPNDPAAGRFALTAVDSKALPFTVLSAELYSLEVTQGTAVLDTTGLFIMPLTTRETVAGSASTYVDTTRGTWTQNAGAITLTVQPGSIASNAQWDGRRLTVMFAIGPSTNTYVYTKQD